MHIAVVAEQSTVHMRVLEKVCVGPQLLVGKASVLLSLESLSKTYFISILSGSCDSI